MSDVVHAPEAQTEKFLTFALGPERYGLEVARVEEIVGLLPITRIPRLPGFVSGVVNLRGRVIPVIDLRLALGMPASEGGELAVIVVVQVQRGATSTVMGVIVDEVDEVVDLPASLIEATPEFGTGVDTSFIKGVGRLETNVVLVLDIDLVLSGSELETVREAASSGEPDSNDGGNAS